MAQTAAKKARSAGLLERVTERAKEVAELVRAKRKIKEALATLEKSPGDSKANLAAGSFYCFYRDDWDKGLPMLALGADGVYDALGKKELVGAHTAEEQVSLADGWFDLVAEHDGIAQARIRAHAAGWYEKALPELTGLAQIRVQKRLEEIEAAESEAEKESGEKEPKTAGKKKPSFAGKWLDNFGSVIEFTVERRNVTGTYQNIRKSAEGHTYTRFEGRITGNVSRDGRKLTAQWTRTRRWGPVGVRSGGVLAFQLAKDGKSFSGTYRQSDGSAGAWLGTRMGDKTDGKFDPPSSYDNQDDRRFGPGGGHWPRRDRGHRGPRGH